MILPTLRLTTSHAGGIFQLGPVTIEWANTIPEGSQLVGQPCWGWTTVLFPNDVWFFGK
jgi:hypothetical protein